MSYECDSSDFFNFYQDSIVFKEHSKLRDKVSLGYFSYALTDDIFIVKTDLKTNDDIKVNYKNIKQNFFVINYPFSGSSIFTDTSNSFYLDEKTTIFSTPNLINGNVKLKKDSVYLNIGIFINRNFVEKNAAFLLEKSYIQKQIPKNQKIKALANEIYNSPFTGNLEILYLQCKVFELIYIQFLHLSQNKQHSKVIFSQYDKEALKKAKLIFQSSFTTAPTIQELSKMVRLNEYKLKYGFRFFYDQTPHQTLLFARLTKAKEMLKSGEYNVSETSQKVGFRHVSSFSKAFVKLFGILPKDVRKKADIYI